MALPEISGKIYRAGKPDTAPYEGPCSISSVTPVCFGTMYTGLSPQEHGIMKYRKPVLQVDTVFDYLVKEKKKAAIISTEGDSISRIFLEEILIILFILPLRNATKGSGSDRKRQI